MNKLMYLAIALAAFSTLTKVMGDLSNQRNAKRDCTQLAIEHTVIVRYSFENKCEVQMGVNWVPAWFYLYKQQENKL